MWFLVPPVLNPAVAGSLCIDGKQPPGQADRYKKEAEFGLFFIDPEFRLLTHPLVWG